MPFFFNAANLDIYSGTLDLTSGLYDIHLVDTIPSVNNITVSDLSLIPSTQPILLTNIFSGTIWNFQSLVFPVTIYNTQPIGFVISKRTEATYSNTNQVIYFSRLLNSSGATINIGVGAYKINLNFGVAGLLTFSEVNTVNIYSSGAYIDVPIPKGLIYMLGTDNNTREFTNPFPTKFNGTYLNDIDSGILYPNYTDRSSNIAPNPVKQVLFEFPERTIRVGTFGWLSNLATAVPCYLYGSNTINGLVDTNINNPSFWTLLASNSIITGSNTWNFMISSNTDYWKFLKWESNTDSFDAKELEFFNSSIKSITINLVDSQPIQN